MTTKLNFWVPTIYLVFSEINIYSALFLKITVLDCIVQIIIPAFSTHMSIPLTFIEVLF